MYRHLIVYSYLFIFENIFLVKFVIVLLSEILKGTKSEFL